jgi:hypothetical protein
MCHSVKHFLATKRTKVTKDSFIYIFELRATMFKSFRSLRKLSRLYRSRRELTTEAQRAPSWKMSNCELRISKFCAL